MVPYGIKVEYSAPVECVPLSDDAKGRLVEIEPPQEIGGHLSISLDPESSRSTRVAIRWHGEGPDPATMLGEELDAFEFYRDLGALYFPLRRVDPPGLKAISAHCIRSAVDDYFLVLSLRSMRPFFYLQASRCRLDRNGATMEAYAGDFRFDLFERAVFMDIPSTEGLGGVRYGAQPLDARRLAEAAKIRCVNYHGFLMTADRRYSEWATADAVVHLAQALEVAAYRAVERYQPSDSSWTFNPDNLLCKSPGQKLGRARPIAEKVEEGVFELWGARNEWVHNGRAQVRPFVKKGGIPSVDKRNLRPLAADDYVKFRAAVFAALDWMGEPGFD